MPEPGDTPTEDADRLAALALLAEPLRRRLYLFVASQADPVGRDAAAAAVGVPRTVAAFHLDKLAESGLLHVEFRRPPGRKGPGAGRPAKLYRAAPDEAAFTVPERHYEVAASLLAEAMADTAEHGTSVEAALAGAARRHGRAVGAALATATVGDRGTPAEGVDRLVELLGSQGYEPRVEDTTITFENCPFHRLAMQQRDLVCGMNLEIAAGILEGAGMDGGRAQLDPAPGRCCVTIDGGDPAH